jgi:hypothetical protein
VPCSISACAWVRLFASRMRCRKRSILTCRHCERSEAIQDWQLDCFVAALLAMTFTA